MFERTVSPQNAPDAITTIEIEFEQGNPVAVNGERMSPATLLTKLNDVAGKTASVVLIWSKTVMSA